MGDEASCSGDIHKSGPLDGIMWAAWKEVDQPSLAIASIAITIGCKRKEKAAFDACYPYGEVATSGCKWLIRWT